MSSNDPKEHDRKKHLRMYATEIDNLYRDMIKFRMQIDTMPVDGRTWGGLMQKFGFLQDKTESLFRHLSTKVKGLKSLMVVPSRGSASNAEWEPFLAVAHDSLRTKLLPQLEREDAGLREIGKFEESKLLAADLAEGEDGDDEEDEWTLEDDVQELDGRLQQLVSVMEQFRSSDFDAKKNPKLWFPGNEVFDVGRLPPHGLRFGADGAVSGAGTDRQGQHYNVAGKWDPDVVAMDAEAPTLTLTKTFMAPPGTKANPSQRVVLNGQQAALAQFTDALR